MCKVVNLIFKLRNFLHLIFSGQMVFIGERGERFIPDHTTRRIDETAPVDFGGFYRFASQFVKGKSILDAGCGYGYGVEYLIREGASSCVGIDYSKRAIKFAKKTYKVLNLSYYIMDACDLSYFKDESFDVALSIEVIEHVCDFKKHLTAIKRVMKNGGILILSTPNKEMISQGQGAVCSKFHTKEFYFEELRDLLNDHFIETVIFENQLVSPFEEGQRRRQEREKRGAVGYTWQPEVATENLTIRCRYLYSNTHSFVAVCLKGHLL